MKKIKYIIVITLLLACKLYSQNPEWMVFNAENSILPSNNIYAIVVDTNNVVWIGTGKGLVGINDESNWQQTELKEHISYLEIDRMNNLWVAIRDLLYKYDGMKYESYKIDDISGGGISSILIDNNNITWFSNYLSVGFIEEDEITQRKLLDEMGKYGIFEEIIRLSQDSNGVLWAGTDNVYGSGFDGILRIDADSIFGFSRKNSNFVGGPIWDICVDRQNRKWFATYYGLQMYNDSSWTRYTPGGTSMQLGGVEIDKNNNLWLTSYMDGHLYKYDGVEFQHFKYSSEPFSPAYSKVIAIDSLGNKWMGTSEGVMVFREGGVILDVEEEQTENGLSFNCYPNPVQDELQIDLTGIKSNSVSIKLYDIFGRELAVINESMSQNMTTISYSTSELPQGIYFVRLSSRGQVITKRIEVLR